ncbi:MAG: class I tRNA ligase family protein, partial [Streptosporangiaceae bacterium]
LFFWVARMMLFGLYANAGLGPEQAVPFRQVALHGLVRDQFGKKMSKSKGNTVDPLSWIDKFGADATRFTLARGANPGGDIAVSEDWAAGARNFCNKLWNAVRFALINGAVTEGLPAAEQLSAADRWILSRLAAVTAQVDEFFEEFEFAKACESLYHFAWDEFCDWYLELAKSALSGGDEAARTTRMVLGVTLDRLLRLLHPFLPFVTDELWTALTGGESVMIARWPGVPAPGATADAGLDQSAPPADPAAEAEIGALMRLVTQVRRFRSDQGLRPGQPVPAVLTGIAGTPLAAHEAQVRALTRLIIPDETFAPTASVQAEGVTVELGTVAGLDVEAERRRASKDLAVAQAEIQAMESKLGNPSFLERAPAAVVAKNRGRLAAAQDEARRLAERLEALPGA